LLKCDNYLCYSIPIHGKVGVWVTVIWRELANHPLILAENIYSMDETSVPDSLKVLASRNELRNYRGARVKRTLITAIECIHEFLGCIYLNKNS
jgi:hypothetical protein